MPFRLIAAFAALINSAIDSLRKDQVNSRINLFCASRLVECAAGDLICIFNDRIGQHWTTDAYVHMKLYFLAKQDIDLRQEAFDLWFLHPLEVQSNRLKSVNESAPAWLKQVISLPKK
ncbi:hypothetical protein PHSC3_001661 [Chlamydiales bacterium STE3]|nr:hypothetical protein PHSC3_001661 [Chlamydiales bacterium STE3]